MIASMKLHINWKTYLVLLSQVTSILSIQTTITSDSFDSEPDLSNVEVVEGYDASLPCAIHSPPLQDVPALTLWYIGDQETPVYSYDQRDTSRSSVEWSDETVFVRGRVKYFHLEHPPVLVLSNATTSDNKLYRCRVDYHKSNSRQAWVRLTVIVPPKKIDVVKRISHVEIGQMNDVMCRVTGGEPPPEVEWLQEGEVVDTKSLRDETKTTYNLLEVPTTRGDLTRPFTCRAKNNKFTPPLVVTFTRNVSCAPLSVTIVPESNLLVSGRETKLKCIVIGSNPPALVNWYQHGEQVNPLRTRVQVSKNQTVSVLLFEVTREYHGSHLVCRAEHPTLPLTALEDIITLNVAYKPNVSLSLGRGLNSKHLKEGNDVFFECHVDANPQPYKMKWLHMDEELNHNKSAGILVSESTLVLQRVQRYRSGRYNCLASNVEGDSMSNTIFIRIKYAPRCAMSPSLRGVALFELTNISCAVDADPANVTFTWTFNNSVRRDQSEIVKSNRYTQEGLKSTISYTPMSERDYGTLLCSAANEVGHQKEPCSFTIISAGPPEEVNNCTVGNVTSHSAGISCLQGFDGGLPQKFLLLVWDTETEILVVNTTSATAPSFSAKPLKPGHTYRAEVNAFNSRGSSSSSVVTIPTLNAAEMHKSLPSMVEPSPLVFIMGLLGGIVLVIAALFFAIVWWVRRSSGREEAAVTQVVLKDSNPDLISVEASADDPSLRECGPTMSNTSYDPAAQPLEVSGYQRYGEDTTSLYRSSSPEANERTRLTSTPNPSTRRREGGAGVSGGGGGGGGSAGNDGGGGGSRVTSKSIGVEDEDSSMSANLLLYEDGINRIASESVEEAELQRDTVVCILRGGRGAQEAAL